MILGRADSPLASLLSAQKQMWVGNTNWQSPGHDSAG